MPPRAPEDELDVALLSARAAEPAPVATDEPEVVEDAAWATAASVSAGESTKTVLVVWVQIDEDAWALSTTAGAVVTTAAALVTAAAPVDVVVNVVEMVVSERTEPVTVA
jgi:hypothetical protein